jgi:hypothetical protein
MTDTSEKIARIESFRGILNHWQRTHDEEARRQINQNMSWVRREVIEARCFKTLTIAPPPAIGGMVLRNVDPFAMIFDPPYLMNMVPIVTDMLDATIGALQAGPGEPPEDNPRIEIDSNVRKGYAFIAMPIVPGDAHFDDVLDAIKEVAQRCGIQAERVDEPQSNERITDRILESIRKAEFVIADLTGGRPNVFYEAGYAQGLKKTPIYIAMEGTKLEFDLKDYPVIFFRGMKELKDSLERRLRGLAEARKT